MPRRGDAESSGSQSVLTAGRRRGWAAWILIAAAFVVPVGGLMAVPRMVPTRIESIAPSVQPLMVPAQLRKMDGAAEATAEVKWVEGLGITAPAWSGLVTEVAVAQGAKVRSGAVIAAIDGVWRMAVASPRPFYRSLSVDDRGPDVKMLKSALSRLGFMRQASVTTDRFDDKTKLAVAKLEAKLTGVRTRDATGVFRPEWFAWMSSPELTAYKILLKVGQPAPALGALAIQGPPVLDSLKVAVGDTVELEQDGRYEFVTGDVVIPLTASLTASSKEIAPLADAVAVGTTNVGGRIRLAATREAIVVPASAVLVAEDGRYCVFIERGDSLEPVSVSVAGGGIGFTQVLEGVSEGDRLVANPGEVHLQCD